MKKEPVWVVEQVVLKIHNAQLAEHGGASGLRDKGLLQSALDHPRNLFLYSEPSLEALATAYAERLIKNHPFVDGNKRTAYVVMQLFLMLNGFQLIAPKEEKLIKFLQLAKNEITNNEFTAWLTSFVKPIKE